MSEAYVRIGQRGQVVIPAPIRHDLKLETGTRLKVTTRGKTISLGVVEEDPYDAFMKALKASKLDEEAWKEIEEGRKDCEYRDALLH